MSKEEDQEEAKNRLDAVKDSLEKYERMVFSSRRCFYKIPEASGDRYVSAAAIECGDRSLFVEITEQEFLDFKERTGGYLVSDLIKPGDCVCDMRNGMPPKYLKFAPENFKAEVVFTQPDKIYKDFNQFKKEYFKCQKA